MSEHYCMYKDGMCELDIDEAYQQGRADKYQEIVSEYMLLTEKQVAEIRTDAIEEMFSKIDKLTVYYAGDKDGNAITPKMLAKKDVIKLLEQLKEREIVGGEDGKTR